MVQSVNHSDMDFREQETAPRHVPGRSPLFQPKRQNVGCFPYLGLLFGAYGILTGGYLLFMAALDMPGRGTMPPGMEWFMIVTSLFLMGVLPLWLSIRSILRIRRNNRGSEENYRRALTEFEQAGPNLNSSFRGGIDMNHYDRIETRAYLQDLCAILAAERTIQGKLGGGSLMAFAGRVLIFLASLSFLWLFWYTIDLIQSFNVYLEWAYGSSSFSYWLEESGEILPDFVGVAVLLVLAVIVLNCGISMSRRGQTQKSLQQELNRLGQLRERAYQLNVIPLQYCTPSNIFYLYNWFSAGTSDDLGIALNTLLHEDSGRLETLMDRQYKTLLEQRIALAMQMPREFVGPGPAAEIRAQLNAYLTGPNHL